MTEVQTDPAVEAAERTLLGAQLARLSRSFYERGWMPGTAGNLSARLAGSDGTALITASGRDKGELTADDMTLVHAATGKTVRDTDPAPSAETSIHAAVYRATDARVVVHVHSPYATAVACVAGRANQSPDSPRRVSTLRWEGFELLKGLGLPDPSGTDMPVFVNWPYVPRIADDVDAYLTRVPAAPGLLIAEHGVTVWGASVAQARNRLECVEAICQLLVLTRAELASSEVKGL